MLQKSKQINLWWHDDQESLPDTVTQTADAAQSFLGSCHSLRRACANCGGLIDLETKMKTQMQGKEKAANQCMVGVVLSMDEF